MDQSSDSYFMKFRTSWERPKGTSTHEIVYHASWNSDVSHYSGLFLTVDSTLHKTEEIDELGEDRSTCLGYIRYWFFFPKITRIFLRLLYKEAENWSTLCQYDCWAIYNATVPLKSSARELTGTRACFAHSKGNLSSLFVLFSSSPSPTLISALHL